MRVFTALVLAAGLSAGANAQSDFEQMPRAQALEHYETVGEEFLEAFQLIYTRTDPELAEYIGSPEWDEVDREAAACVYDTYAESGELENMAIALEQTEVALERLREDDSITMIALMTGEVDRAFLTAGMPEDVEERNIEVSQACGVLEANSRRWSDPELMQRLMAHMERAQ